MTRQHSKRLLIFQSTPLMRGETIRRQPIAHAIDISIHSPHARGDSSPLSQRKGVIDFNPLPSCEGRPAGTIPSLPISKFQSTPLMRGETKRRAESLGKNPFQSTPLMRGETTAGRVCPAVFRYFNPLPSCEGRQHKPLKIRLDSRQSIQQKHHSSFF